MAIADTQLKAERVQLTKSLIDMIDSYEVLTVSNVSTIDVDSVSGHLQGEITLRLPPAHEDDGSGLLVTIVVAYDNDKQRVGVRASVDGTELPLDSADVWMMIAMHAVTKSYKLRG